MNPAAKGLHTLFTDVKRYPPTAVGCRIGQTKEETSFLMQSSNAWEKNIAGKLG